jgi:hypothetical protein
MAKVAKTSEVEVAVPLRSLATLVKNNPYVRKIARHELYMKKEKIRRYSRIRFYALVKYL